MRPSRSLLLAALVAMVTGTALGADADHVGKKIADFKLKSQFGKDYALADFAHRDVVVVVFLGAECPLAKVYAPRLAKLAQSYGDRVGFIGIDSNQQDSIQEIAAYAQRHEIAFPLLKDPGNVVADQFGAHRTPEVFVLDRDRVVRYQGRIDDQFGFDDGAGFQRPAPTRKDLSVAVDELLAGKPVSVATTKVAGCHIGRVKQANANSDVTYSNQVARIFQAHCVECHRAGRIGPFEMTSYDKVAGWGEMIREVVSEGRMPPWHANPKHGAFTNDLRLSDKDKQTIIAWVDNGCPQGDSKDLPAPRQFVDGWEIGEPDQVIYMREQPVDVPAEGVIDYHHYVADPGWTEDKWIQAAEAKPGSMETVHHILVFVQPPGTDLFRNGPPGEDGRPQRAAQNAGSNDEGPRERGRDRGGRGGFGRARRAGEGGGGGGLGGGNLIAGYAPGMNPMFASDGTTAIRVKAGSKLIFQLHYTPNGSPAKDRSYVGFKFADPEKVKFAARSTSVVNAMFAIPPGNNNYEAAADTTFENDTLVTCMTPHMHTRGKSFRYEVTYPDGKQEVLLDVPAYDFNWQTTYHLKEPKLLPKGTKLVCTAHWDNSEENLSNPDPKKTVTWGSQTFEEMMIGFYIEVFPKDQVPANTSGGRGFNRLDPEQVFSRLDANADGQLTKEELPGPLKERFELADLNGDGSVSKDELTKILKLFSGAQGRRPAADGE